MKTAFAYAALIASLAGCPALAAEFSTPAATSAAKALLEASGTTGGLIVHLGCGDARLTAALAPGEGFVVHGLARAADQLAPARRHIRQHGLYGSVSIDRLAADQLPYCDNLVNLVVAEQSGDVPMEEMMRVLAPGGVLLLATSEDKAASAADRGELAVGGRHWRKVVKPWPETIDQWTHWLHDPSGNAVARDKQVGPPRHYRWTASPRWSRHHDTVLATSAAVTAGGRLFCIIDEAPSSEFHQTSSGRWSLLARDAFNGVLLWRKPIESWGWQAWGVTFKRRFAQPVQLPSRLVAQGDRLFATLGFHAPVSRLEAATGRVLHEYKHTRCADEILLHRGRLIVSVYDPEGDPAEKSVRAVDVETGELVWQIGAIRGLPARYDEVEGLDPVYLTACDDRVVLVSKAEIVCLEAADGNVRWKTPRPEHHEHRMHLGVRQSENCSLVNDGDVVLYTQPVGQLGHTNHTVPCDLYALSADTGQTLWKTTCGTWAWGHQADAFVIDGLVWVHKHIPTQMRGPSPVELESLEHELLGLDLRTGQVERRFPTSPIFHVGHHHRCYRNKATTRYVFTARRGTELTDLATGQLRLHPWVRSECRFGIVPANGLLYTFPHPCACYAGVKLTGLNALAASTSPMLPVPATRRLERGPAAVASGSSSVGQVPSPDSEKRSSFDTGTAASTEPVEWPTYRHDAARSGAIEAAMPTRLKPAWTAQLGGRLAGPVVAQGKLLLARPEDHSVHALDAASGEPLWSFTAGGPVDSPPTIARGCAVFGSTDGRIYCLDAADGSLRWRFLAAPTDRRMTVDGRLESVWPVHGSVLVQGGEVVAVAGRSSYLDGGLQAYRLDLKTGRLLQQRRIAHQRLADRRVIEAEGALFDHYFTEGCLGDVLVGNGKTAFVKTLPVFDQTQQPEALLVSHAGFLDASRFSRAFWYLLRSGQPALGAQLIVYDDAAAYGFRAYRSPNRGGPWHELGSGYSLVASPRTESNKAAGSKADAGPLRLPPFTRRPPNDLQWRRRLAVRAQAMALAENVVLVAGSPDVVKPGQDAFAAVAGRLGGRLLLIARGDGSTAAEFGLPSPPVWEGMALAGGRVYLALLDGSVVALGPPQRE